MRIKTVTEPICVWMNVHYYYNYILTKITPLIIKQATHLRNPISPNDRLLATLRYLATGETFIPVCSLLLAFLNVPYLLSYQTLVKPFTMH